MEENLNKKEQSFFPKRNENTWETHDKAVEPQTFVTSSNIKQPNGQGKKTSLTMILSNNVESSHSVNSKEKGTYIPPLLPPPEALLKEESLQNNLARGKEKLCNDSIVFSNGMLHFQLSLKTLLNRKNKSSKEPL
jgi:hypothetical protein